MSSCRTVDGGVGGQEGACIISDRLRYESDGPNKVRKTKGMSG